MRCVSLCWALNQGARCGWSLSANYISLVIIVCELDLQSLTLCNCFINKIVQLYITSEIERRARQWTPRWADKKKEERVSIQSWSEGKNLSWSSSRWFMRGEYAWFVLGSKNLPSRFKSDLNAVQRGGVQLNTISKPIKGCIRITAMYLLLWDITLRVLQLQSGGSKFHWLERWGAIETKKKKAKKIKKTLCAEMKPAHNSHRVEHPRCVVRGWSFKHSVRSQALHLNACFVFAGCFWQLHLREVAAKHLYILKCTSAELLMCGAFFCCCCCWENVSEDVLWDCCHFWGFLWAS